MQIDDTDINIRSKIRKKVIGRPRNIRDPTIFHKIALIAILSWIGLGADGLSSSSYGPPEAFKIIGSHTYLAIFLALITALTVFIISFTYSRIIEAFPHGGGGYIVATHTLGRGAGVISGSALLIDYVLTITVSIAACGDAIFSFLPPAAWSYSLLFKVLLIFILIILNLRGIKESVMVLAPIFLLFIVTHVLLLGYGIFSHATSIGTHASNFSTSLGADITAIGFIGILAIILRAFSLGAGTFTGLEAVSNGLPIMREPKVHTGKKTMMYMAISLALVAGSLYLCYYLVDVPAAGNVGPTQNAILANTLFGGWPLGYWIAFIIILSEGLLLFVAAQTGFIDGPRVMANMAVDNWFPKRLASLSERLTMHNGVMLMGGIALILMVITDGDVTSLVIMYAINVFITFSLSELGMARLSIKSRHTKKDWKRKLGIFVVGFIVCFTILIIMIYEKVINPFLGSTPHPEEGIWGVMTLVITSIVIFICYYIHRHYEKIRQAMRKFNETLLLSNIHLADKPNNTPIDPTKPTAVLFVNRYTGFGVNTFLSISRNFPRLYDNFIFVSVAQIDSGIFKGAEGVEALERSVRGGLMKYVQLARRLGFAADYRMDIGTDVVETASQICETIASEYPKSTYFTGRIVFRHETLFHKILHNETALAIQRRLQWKGMPVVIIPVRLDV